MRHFSYYGRRLNSVAAFVSPVTLRDPAYSTLNAGTCLFRQLGHSSVTKETETKRIEYLNPLGQSKLHFGHLNQ